MRDYLQSIVPHISWSFFTSYFRDVAMKALNSTGQNHINMDSLYEVNEQIHFGCLLLL